VYSHHKFGHEWNDSPAPHVSYMVCSVPRSGSSLLCDVLAGTELAGAPTEYFDLNQMEAFSREWGVSGTGDYVQAMFARKTSPNGVFGVKAHFHQLGDVLGHHDIDAVFPDLRLVYVRRRDHVRQAVSWSRATQTGQWASDHPAGSVEPRFDAREIATLVERIEREERGWEDLFEHLGRQPLRIDYEELAPDAGLAVRRVFKLIGVEPGPDFEPPAPTILRQADGLSEGWVRRYRDRPTPR
jgi:trehalose 2-sulfotransferase